MREKIESKSDKIKENSLKTVDDLVHTAVMLKKCIRRERNIYERLKHLEELIIVLHRYEEATDVLRGLKEDTD